MLDSKERYAGVKLVTGLPLFEISALFEKGWSVANAPVRG